MSALPTETTALLWPFARSRHQKSIPLAEALADATDWEDLARTAVRPRPFHLPASLAAHRSAGFCRGVRVLRVPSASGLAACLPFVPGGAALGWLGRAHLAWRSPFTTSGDPLLAPGAAPALLDAMAGAAPGVWLFGSMTLSGGSGALLREEAARRGWPQAVLDPFARAVLEWRPTFAAYEAAVGASRRKDLRRRRRRLDEMGVVTVETATSGPQLADAIEAFLQLEAAGWKGGQGTAMACRTATAELARTYFGRPGPGVGARADVLALDGRPIAVSLALVSGGTAHLLKTAYDESLARVSPGLLLEDEIVRALHGEGFADRLDSAAVAGSHMETIYPDREEVGDWVVATDGRTQAALDASVSRERARRRWRQTARCLRDRWQARLERRGR